MTSPGSDIIITAVWMMDLETLLKVQVGLLHPLANGPHFKLHGGHGLLHGGHRHLHIAHPPLKSSKSLHNLRNIDLLFRRRDSVRGWRYVRKSNMHRNRHILIRILSPQLRIWLQQSLFAEGLFHLHPRLSINIDTGLQDDLSKEAAKRKTGSALITSLEHDSQNMLAETERKEKVNSINKLGLLQYQITVLGNRPQIVHNFGQWWVSNIAYVDSLICIY